jgi:hypothetical protein
MRKLLLLDLLDAVLDTKDDRRGLSLVGGERVPAEEVAADHGQYYRTIR